MPKFFPIPSYDENEVPILPVILYHTPRNDLLELHFQWIRANGYTPVHLGEVSTYFVNPKSVPFPSKRLVLTFDDAYQDFYSNSCSLLTTTFGFKATLCVPTGDIPYRDSDRWPLPRWTEGKGPLMTWNELKELRQLKTAQGEDVIEFIPHSVTHRYFDELEKLGDPEKEFQQEVKDSKEKLSKELGIGIASIRFYCLPGGIGEGKEVIERVLDKENYIGALRAQYKKGDKWSRYRVPRCEPRSMDDLERLLSKDGFSCN